MSRDPNKEDYDNKDWFFILEDVTAGGKRKPVAQGRLNMRDFASAVPTQHNLTVKLRPISKKVTAARLTLTLTAELLKEGKATDDDMRSIASLVSNSTVCACTLYSVPTHPEHGARSCSRDFLSKCFSAEW